MRIADHARLTQLYDDHDRRCWHLYPGYLTLSALPQDVDIVEDSHAGSAILYRRRKRSGRAETELYTPPMPCTPEALDYSIQQIQAANGRKRVRIAYVEPSEIAQVARSGFRLYAREEQAILDAGKFRGSDGAAGDPIRSEIGLASSLLGVACRDYRAEDEAGCLEVLTRRDQLMKQAGLPIQRSRLTRDCLRHAGDFPRDAIRGRVAEVDGEMCGFSFAGPMGGDFCNLFLTVADADIRGLADMLRHDQMMNWPEMRYFNDGANSGTKDPRALNQAFLPIAYAPVYRALLS